MEAILAIALVFSIAWAVVCGCLGLIMTTSGGGAQHTVEKLLVVIILAVGFGPLAYVLYKLFGG